MKKNRTSLSLSIFIILSLCSFIIEHTLLKSSKKCNKKYIILSNFVSLLHNMGSIYATFGSLLFGHYILHFICLIIVLITWYISKKIDKKMVSCIITQIYNRLCGFDKSRNFHDLNYYIFNRILGIKNFYLPLLLSIILYDLYNIYFTHFKTPISWVK